MTESVITMNTKNAMDDDISAFSFVLAGDVEWDKLLTENDMVILKLEPNEYSPKDPYKKDKVRTNTVIIGLISEVRIEGTYSDDLKMYRITGQSFQKAFANFELRTIQQAGHVAPAEIGWLDMGDQGFGMGLMGKTVVNVATEIINRFKGKMKYTFKSEEEAMNLTSLFEQKVVYNFQSWYDDENLINPLNITSFEGTLNQLIRSIASPPFLEYFFDVFPSSEGYEKIHMVIRRTPFDKGDWQNLNTLVLKSRDVVEENFARNDLDTYSIYNLVPEMASEEISLTQAVPYYHPRLVDKYGYKLLETKSEFLTFKTSGTGDEPKPTEGRINEGTIPAKFGKKLYEWFSLNPNFYAGELTVMGHPDYRIGNRLVYENEARDEVWEFYIESVEHTFSYEEGYLTTLGVTRGLRVKNRADHGIRFNRPLGEPEIFKGGYLGEMSLAEIQDAHDKAKAEQDLSVGSGQSDVVIQHSGSIQSPLTKPIRVTSPYGMRVHPITGVRKMHSGIDLVSSDYNIRSIASGKVVTSLRHNSYGNYIIVNHGNLNNQRNVTSLYAHMSNRAKSTGDMVQKGEVLGRMGQTGSATGDHLHFEVRIDGKGVNPTKWASL